MAGSVHHATRRQGFPTLGSQLETRFTHAECSEHRSGCSEEVPALAFGRHVRGPPGLGAPVAGSPGGAHSRPVSLSFMDVLSFIDDILVKLLWLG